jgi:hypothetical protein
MCLEFFCIYTSIANFMKWRYGKEVVISCIRTLDRYTKLRTITGHLHWLMGLVIEVRFLADAETLFWAPHTNWPRRPHTFLLDIGRSFLKSASRSVKMAIYLRLGQRIRINGNIPPLLYKYWRFFYFKTGTILPLYLYTNLYGIQEVFGREVLTYRPTECTSISLKRTFEIYFEVVGLRALIYRHTNCVHTRVTVLSLQVTRKDNNFQYIVTLPVLQVQPWIVNVYLPFTLFIPVHYDILKLR